MEEVGLELVEKKGQGILGGSSGKVMGLDAQRSMRGVAAEGTGVISGGR